jgi:hypothetical protein
MRLPIFTKHSLIYPLSPRYERYPAITTPIQLTVTGMDKSPITTGKPEIIHLNCDPSTRTAIFTD